MFIHFEFTGSIKWCLAEGYPAGLNAPDFEEGAGEEELANKLKELEAKL